VEEDTEGKKKVSVRRTRHMGSCVRIRRNEGVGEGERTGRWVGQKEEGGSEGDVCTRKGWNK